MDQQTFSRTPPSPGEECWWEESPQSRIAAKNVLRRHLLKSRHRDLIGLIDQHHHHAFLCVATSTHRDLPGCSVLLDLSQEPDPLATARDATEALCFLERFRIHPQRASPLKRSP